MFKKIIYNIFDKLLRQTIDYKTKERLKSLGISSTVKLSDSSLIGNIYIGEYTYVNNGTVFSSGDKSKVIIGKYCAIGRYVHITAKGHDLKYPTADETHVSHRHVEADTNIGNYVWIGDHVFIKHGVTVGDYAIIGANSVVTKDVKEFEIVGGVPAKHIRFNKEHHKFKND